MSRTPPPRRPRSAPADSASRRVKAPTRPAAPALRPTGAAPLDVLVVGGGMICHDQLLPSLYQLQRLGHVGTITVCARHGRTLRTLADNATLRDAFPGQSFVPVPDPGRGDPDRQHPTAYADALARLAPDNLVLVALPDHLHDEAICAALVAGQHVISVKPLVLRHRQAAAIARLARQRGLFVGVEYHKRFDDRALLARQQYRAGGFGEFRLGHALLLEPWNYRQSNFQNWCTCEHTDLFTYVGCHYVDLVAFITGLRPTAVSVYGLREPYPNGRQGFLWTDARVLWENGACLNVQNAIGYPDAGPGSNTQGLRMFCRGHGDGCFLLHSDQNRGVAWCLDTTADPAAKRYHEPNPDYLRLVYRGGPGLEPVGYGYRSLEALVQAAGAVRHAGPLAARRRRLVHLDADGVLATPANSAYNEQVIEAARRSILANGRTVRIGH